MLLKPSHLGDREKRNSLGARSRAITAKIYRCKASSAGKSDSDYATEGLYMEIHHRPVHREDDDELVCSRCGLINPGDGEPCISAYSGLTQTDEAE